MMTRKDYVATAEILKYASDNKKKYTRKIKHKNKFDQ